MTEQGYDWDETIDDEGVESFSVLPAGTYDFEISKVEKSRFAGSQKIPPCNMAKVTFSLTDDAGHLGYATENFKLHSVMKWHLCKFFVAVGDMMPGTPLQMDWDALPGKTGIAKVGVRKYTSKNGDEREVNEIKELLPAENTPAIPSTPAVIQPPPVAEDDIPF